MNCKRKVCMEKREREKCATWIWRIEWEVYNLNLEGRGSGEREVCNPWSTWPESGERNVCDPYWRIVWLKCVLWWSMLCEKSMCLLFRLWRMGTSSLPRGSLWLCSQLPTTAGSLTMLEPWWVWMRHSCVPFRWAQEPYIIWWCRSSRKFWEGKIIVDFMRRRRASSWERLEHIIFV